MLRALIDYSEWIINEPNIYLTLRKGKKNKLTITNARIKRELNLSFDYFTQSDRNQPSFYFPYFMHPGFYRFKHLKNVDALRNTKRTINTFFIGGIGEKNYSSQKLKEEFGTNNRWETIDFLKRYRTDLVAPNSLEELDKKVSDESVTLLIVNTENFFVKQVNLHGYYSLSNFHLALPGVVMPICHNIIEAMVVGCIPILAYPQHFHPALEHGKNCLVYGNLEEKMICLENISL